MNPSDIYENRFKGTTTVGIVCADGVVIGADSRATMDTFIASTEAVKIYKVDENLGITIAGGVGDAEYVVKLLKVHNELFKMNENKPLSPTSASSLLSLILQEHKMYPFIVQLIVGGMNSGAPEIFSLDPFGGSIKESRFTSTGSGSLTALGYLESAYAPDMSAADAVKVAAMALTIAIKRDAATGNNMKIASITKKGYKEYGKEELDRLMK